MSTTTTFFDLEQFLHIQNYGDNCENNRKNTTIIDFEVNLKFH